MGENAQEALDALSRAQHGLVTRAQALAAGLSEKAIERRLASNEFERVHRRVYRLRSGPEPTIHQRILAACLTLGGVASHRTAAWLWNLDGFRQPETLDITAGYGHRCTLKGIRVHQRRNAATELFVKIAGVPVTILSRTLLDLTPLLKDGPLEVALDSAGRQRFGFLLELKEFLSTLPGNGVTGIQRLYDLVALRTGNEPTGSAHETLVLQAVRRAGIEDPCTQYPIFKTIEHPLCHADFAWPRKKIALFVDSNYHLGKRARLDAIQRMELQKLGWRPVTVFKKSLETREWIASFAELFHVPL